MIVNFLVDKPFAVKDHMVQTKTGMRANLMQGYYLYCVQSVNLFFGKMGFFFCLSSVTDYFKRPI